MSAPDRDDAMPLSVEERRELFDTARHKGSTWHMKPPEALRIEATILAVEAERDRLAEQVARLEGALRREARNCSVCGGSATKYHDTVQGPDWSEDCKKCAPIRAALADDGGPGGCPACGAPGGYPPAGPCEWHGTARARLIGVEEADDA